MAKLTKLQIQRVESRLDSAINERIAAYPTITEEKRPEITKAFLVKNAAEIADIIVGHIRGTKYSSSRDIPRLLPAYKQEYDRLNKLRATELKALEMFKTKLYTEKQTILDKLYFSDNIDIAELIKRIENI